MAVDLSNFLTQVKNAIDNNNYEVFDNRYKYRRTLALLGLTDQDVLDDIYDLNASDGLWCEPDLDARYPGDVWQCKKILHGTCIYIKLKIREIDGNYLVVMSYHIDNMR